MTTAKFGGTATNANNLKYLISRVTDNVGAVVVSACGRDFDGDEKVTDLLSAYYDSHSDAVWQQICDKFRRLCIVNGIDYDLDTALAETKTDIVLFDKAYCLSVGEELTAKIVACALARRYVEAANYVVFRSDGSLDEAETERRIAAELVGQRFVVGGFYGATKSGQRMTFARGGGDTSGAIFAAFSGATLYENFTDVDGVYSANPNKVFCPVLLRQISYGQMRLLSTFGAEVLHPDSVGLAQKYGVTTVVRNFYGADNGTTVGNAPCTLPLVGVTTRRCGGGYVTYALHNLGCSVTKVAAKLCETHGQYVTRVSCDKALLVVCGKIDLTNAVYRCFDL